ncbi:hypothetical protein Tco_1273593 [Tanacetum coccineum]
MGFRIFQNGTMEHLGQGVLKLLMDWLPSKHNLIILEGKSRRLMRSSAELREDSTERNNANPSYQEQRQSMEESLSKFMTELSAAKRDRREKALLDQEIRASTDAAIRNQGASIKALEIQIGLLYDDCCDEKKGSYGLKDLDTYSIGTTLRNDSLPKKEKDPGCFTLPCYINNVCFKKALSDLGASSTLMQPDFEERLGKIYGRGVHRVHVLDFRGLTDTMAEGLSGRMLMEHKDAQGLNTAYPGPRWKEIDNVGGVSIIWNPMCVIVMLEFRRIYNTHSCSYTQLVESYRANIRGVSRSNSFISRF